MTAEVTTIEQRVLMVSLLYRARLAREEAAERGPRSKAGPEAAALAYAISASLVFGGAVGRYGYRARAGSSVSWVSHPDFLAFKDRVEAAWDELTQVNSLRNRPESEAMEAALAAVAEEVPA